ncbi:MAG: hypothetical protein HGJ94_14100 [Desulfosarcina sp.]|nr:hypothetical protein [Desulfosarcina sp.]MBC2741536.1 hypothetical protein [Desulfosarcina sp.]MBC2764450.1 hypothetical protein [Desulfosarcina sp.]
MRDPYGAVPRALESTRLTLRDIMADNMAQRTEAGKLRMAMAGITAEKEVSKMANERALSDLQFRHTEARLAGERSAAQQAEASRHNKAMEGVYSRSADVEEARENRLGAEAAEERTPVTREQAFDRLGIGPMQRQMINSMVPVDKKLPLKAFLNLANAAKEQPRIHGAWMMSKLYDNAEAISKQPPSPENLKALTDIKRQIRLLEIGVSEGALKANDVIKARETLMEQWEDVAANPDGMMYQQFMQAAGDDDVAAGDLFVERGIKDLKQLSGSSSFEDQSRQLQASIKTFTDKTTPKPPEGLAGQVTAEIDRIAGAQGPEAAGAFKKEMAALFGKQDFAGMQRRLDKGVVPDEMFAGHEKGRSLKVEGGSPAAEPAAPSLKAVTRKQTAPDYSRYKNPVVGKDGTVWARVDGKPRRVPGGIRPAETVRDGQGNVVPNPKYESYRQLLRDLGLDKSI